MKQNWEIKKLSEVLKIQNGYAFDAKLFTIEKGTPLIRIRDIKEGVGTVTNFNGKYDKKYEVNAGDFLIGMDGEFGCYEWKGDTALLNQRVCRLQEFSNKLYPRFLFYGINKYLKAIEDVTAFATVKHISSKQIENIEIPLPPLSEQKRIVATLDEAFAAIAKAKLNAEQNLKNAAALFESYLQGVFENKGDGWEEKTLGVVYDVRDGTHDSPKYQEEGFPLITSKNLKKDLLNYDNVNYISEQDYININKRSKVDKGDILFAMIGTIGNPVVIQDEPDFAIKNVALFKVPKEQNSYFLKYYLDAKSTIDKMMGDAKGTTQKFVGLGYLRGFKILLPPLKEQQNIVQKLDALSTETKKLEAIYQQKINDLEELKKSVLQKAFNGELKTDKLCVISDKIVFCTCETGSYEDLPHYWLLYRFDKQKDLMCVGEPMIPYDFLQLDYSINKDTLAKRLNEEDAFDKIIEFKPKDQLEIVINNLAKAEIERMTFCFKYKSGKWIAEEYDTFELMNRYDELAFGNLEKIEAI